MGSGMGVVESYLIENSLSITTMIVVLFRLHQTGNIINGRVKTPPFWRMLILIIHSLAIAVCLLIFIGYAADAIGLEAHPLTAILFIIGSAIIVDFINDTRASINDGLEKLLRQDSLKENE